MMLQNQFWLVLWTAILVIIGKVVTVIPGAGLKTEESEFRKTVHCPPKCTCRIGYVHCTEIEWPVLSPSTVSLEINNYLQNSIAKDNLHHLLYLHKFIIHGNLINIPDFPVLKELVYLDLSKNRIDKSSAYYLSLPSLTYLNLSSNLLRTLEDFKFIKGLNNLQNLDLSKNPLTTMSHHLPIPTLRNFDISHTQLSYLPHNLFYDLPQLEFFNASHSHLKIFPTVNGNKLKVLDISFNRLTLLPHFDSSDLLEELYCGNNFIEYLSKNNLANAINLKILDLQNNHLHNIDDYLFTSVKNLEVLILNNNINLKRIENHAFSGLNKLVSLQINNCAKLQEIENWAFYELTSLKNLDLRNTGLLTLPLYSPSFINLNSVNFRGTKLLCDCHLYLRQQWLKYGPIQCQSGEEWTENIAIQKTEQLQCSEVEILSEDDKWIKSKWDTNTFLECNATGNPPPIVIWQTSDHMLLMNPEILNNSLTQESNTEYIWTTHKFQSLLENILQSQKKSKGKFYVKTSGTLLITQVHRQDVGRYKCFAFNSVSNASSVVFLALQDNEFYAFYIETVVVGTACAVIFLMGTLIAQLIRYLMDRCGWECCCCCCKERLSPKARKIKTMLESIETYRSQQLEKLRENYTCQVTSIKESCYQQVERLRESYAQQTKNLRDLRDYSTQQLGTMRDQYVEQVNKIREYSMQQMNKVRENYVFQRQRVRKFSAHQMLWLRETYKYQQKTLNKILENLPDLYLQNCRTGGHCNRTDSIQFDEIDDLDMYYKLDFLDTHSHNSDYYTPKSTLSRSGQLKMKVPSYNNSNTSISTDYHEAQSFSSRRHSEESSVKQLTCHALSPTPVILALRKFSHFRSHSTTIASNNSEPVKVHKRSLSATNSVPKNATNQETLCSNRKDIETSSDKPDTSIHINDTDLVENASK